MNRDQSQEIAIALFANVRGVSSMCGLLFSILCFFGQIAEKKSVLITILFYVSIDVGHAFNVMKTVMPKFEVEQNTLRKLFVCSDFHMIILSLFFILTDSTNVFYVFDYIVECFIESLSFVINVLTLEMKLNGPYLSVIKQINNSPLLPMVSPVVELIVAIFLLINSIIKMSFSAFILCAAYIFFVNIVGVATNESHSRLWNSIGLQIREFAAKNGGSVGSFLENLCDKGEQFTAKLRKFFPRREIKVHLQ